MYISIIILIILFPFWALLHEVSHLLASHWLVGLKEWDLTIVPRYKDGRWLFARYEWIPVKEPTKGQYFIINLAPRIPNLIAAIAFVFTPWPLALFWVGGLIDLGVGSWGKSVKSDLRRASVNANINPWYLRIGGFTVIGLSVLIHIMRW